MTQPTNQQRPPGFFKALWIAFIAFLGSLFKKSPSAAGLPIPATSRSPNRNVNTNEACAPTSTIKLVHQRISFPAAAWVKEPRPLKHRATTTAARSRALSMSRTTPPRRSRSVTPRLTISDPESIFHPPASPFPNISLSGIFATPPSSPPMRTDSRIGRLTLSSPPVIQHGTHVFSPGSPPPFHHVSPSSIKEKHQIGTSPSIRSVYSRPPNTPKMPASAVVIRLDPGTLSPTVMSDGSFEVISLGDHRGFLGSPIKVASIERLPSPWSPIGRFEEEDVWMSVDGVLMKAGGPVNDDSIQSTDEFVILSPVVLAASSSLYSTTSDLDGFDISVFVNLDSLVLEDGPRREDNKGDTEDDPTKPENVTKPHDGNRSPLVTQEASPPRKRRDTVPSITRSQSPSSCTSPTKRLSTPLARLDNVDLNHFRSTSSIASMAYEFRLGLLADGRGSMTALENIISFLEQDSSESAPPRIVRGPVEVPVAGLVEAV